MKIVSREIERSDFTNSLFLPPRGCHQKFWYVIRTDLFPLAGLKEEHDSGYDAVAMSQINSSGSAAPVLCIMALFQLPIKSS